ncbi:coiled-coil domain-containing protein 86 isoform X2 [Sphaerodactylus townsendi]|uniref:coiled-coil domain-containing protein 86 isoform X2 n=1 Tax=Sphaerodactylus townsendi TaxID=933632 RepID=UPI00202683B9|nr:coiled-coil domain-containing protein 86 isoform X2 [Sphaerodactylus townsendi]
MAEMGPGSAETEQAAKFLPHGNAEGATVLPETQPGKPQGTTLAKKRKEVEVTVVIPKGKPKSGRVWKDPGKKRFSHMIQDKPLHTSWERKMKVRQEKKAVKDFVRQLEEEKQREREAPLAVACKAVYMTVLLSPPNRRKNSDERRT